MSMELMAWREAGPITREQAAAVYRAAREAQPGEPAVAEVAALVKELPGHAVGYPGHALVTMTPEALDEVSNATFALARRYGLVCYDPQGDLVHNLSPLGVDPETQLHTGDGMMVVNPDLGLVRDVLGTLSAQNPFAVLVTFGHHFIQVSPGYELEYKEGTLRTTLVTDLEEVRRAFDEYARGERGFLDRFEWTSG
ncbi:hypothetical protein ACFXJ8_16690 [Nonomuraea sp. NPDC059194]|uniref:hypothetical protein n=1 Tax=Nonomuraea sp. NPDC059194 TaxID=3346764 RepID=UPI00367D7FA2